MKKKGFTLIELLAVILILGIIALIAIPTVNKIIEESKRGAFKTTVENLLRAAEQECQMSQLKEQAIIDKYTFENGKVKTFRAEKLENGTLNVKGDLPKSGTIKVNDSCSVSIDEENPLSDGTFIANTKDGNIAVAKTGEKVVYTVYNAGDTIYYNPVDNVKCSAEDEVADRTGEYNGNDIGSIAGKCKKWHVIETDDNDKKGTIDVILNHGVDVKEWIPNDALYEESSLKAEVDMLILPVSSGGKGWNANLKPRLITVDEIAKITGADKEDTIKWSSQKEYSTSWANINIDTQTSWFYLDGGKNSNKTSYSTTDGWRKRYASSSVKSDYYWLFDNLYDCTDYGCSQEELGCEYSSGYIGSSYWVDGDVICYSDDDCNGWAIFREGKFSIFGITGEGEAEAEFRPVITISKDIIK